MYLGAFGKHPGWNDHIDDQGLETQRLVDFKSLMYVEGLSAAIDSGKWDALDPGQQVEGFGHVFLMRARGEILAGRMWSSTDGKGRSKYPMVVVAQCTGAPLDWVAAHVLPALENTERECIAATSAAQVIAVLDGVRGALREKAQRIEPGQPEASIPATFVKEMAGRSELGPAREGFNRIVYQIDREMGDYVLGSSTMSRLSRADAAPTHHVRVPALGADVAASLLGWSRFMLTRVQAWSPMLLIAPRTRPWVDIIIGEPSGGQLFCIRASDKTIPLTSAIPYTLDAGFLASVDKWLSDTAQAGTRVIQSADSTRPKRGGATGGRFMSPVAAAGLGMVGIACVGGAILALRESDENPGTPKPSQPIATDPTPASKPLAVAVPVVPAPPPAPVVAHTKPETPVTIPQKPDATAIVQSPGNHAAPNATADAAQWDGAAWRTLCMDYRDWFATFLRRLDEKPPDRFVYGPGVWTGEGAGGGGVGGEPRFATRRAWYASEPGLRAILAKIEAAGLTAGGNGTNPWEIAGVSDDGDLLALSRNAPERARSAENAAKIEAAAEVIDYVERALFNEWRPLTQMNSTIASFRTRGWEKAAAFLGALSAGVRPGAGHDVAGALDVLLAAVLLIAPIDAKWEQVQGSAVKISASGDPVLAKFGAWIAQSTRRPAFSSPIPPSAVSGLSELRAIDAQLTMLAGLSSRLVDFLNTGWSSTDQDLFRRRSSVHKPGVSPSRDVYEAWLFEVKSYPSLDPALDPRKGWKVAELAAEVGGRVDALSRVGANDAKALSDEVADLRTRVDETSKLPWNKAEQGEIVSRVAMLESAHRTLRLRLDRALEEARSRQGADAEQVRAALKARGEVVADSAALNAAWRSWRDELLRTFDDARFRDVEKAARAAEAFLVDVDKRVPGVIDAPHASTTAWMTALNAQAMARREKALAQLVATWEAAGGLPDFDDPGVQGQVANAAAAQTRWLADAAALAADLARVDQRLDAARAISDTAQGPSIGQTMARWATDPLLKDAGVRRAIAPVTDRIDALAAIDNQTDARALVSLVQQARADRPELALGAWRRLGAVRSTPSAPAWPATGTDLETEAAFAEPIKRVIASIADPGRREALTAELSEEQSRRFRRFLSFAADPAAMEAGLRLAPAFGTTRDQFDPRLRFNLALIELKSAVSDPAMTDAEAKKAVQEFLADAEALPGGVAFLGEAQAAIVPLRELVSGNEPTVPAVDVTKLGPGATGAWTGTLDGLIVRFKPTAGLALPTLEFIRVEPGPGGPSDAAYLCTTELSVGTAAALTAQRGSPADMAQLFPRFEPLEDPRQGPRSWQWDTGPIGAAIGAPANAAGSVRPGGASGGLVPPSDWLARATVEVAYPDYPTGQAPARPSVEDPMQQISPAAAVYLARLAGCRLPTVAEWNGAQAQHGRDVPRPQSNLRDQRWRIQQEYVDKLLAEGRPAPAADAGAFLPASIAPTGPRAARSHPWNDGVLWFAPVGVGAGTKVHHLVGNVSEWTFDGAMGDLPEARAGAVTAYVAAQAANLRVVGASSLSDPEIDPLKGYSVVLDEAQEGYADVGVRLAFGAPGSMAPQISLAVRVDRVLTPVPVLSPK